MLLSSRHLHHHKFTPTTSPPAAFPFPHHRRLRPLRPPTLPSANAPQPSPLPLPFPSPRRQWRWRRSTSGEVLGPPQVEADANATGGGKKSFWAAVSLIIGTAVGPGMLGLPSATIRSGQAPSAAAILLSWAYVVSSIVLVAELSFSAMERDGVDEVSFTGLASSTLGADLGAVVAVVYAALSFSLIVACVAGIGSLLAQLFPSVNPVLANALFPCFAGVLIAFFPFKAVDGANRALCGLMLVSITALVVTGVSVGRCSLLSSLGYACWTPGAILPAIPVTVLTLGFHVITPFICKIVGDSVYDARKAILIGGAVPLAMVLSWNAVILGLASAGGNAGIAFSKALDFAGVYANCFLFGILPPVMAWIHRSQKRKRSPDSCEDVLPGGNAALLILFSIAVVLAIWH